MKVQIYEEINFDRMKYKRSNYPKETIKYVNYLTILKIKYELKKIRKNRK